MIKNIFMKLRALLRIYNKRYGAFCDNYSYYDIHDYMKEAFYNNSNFNIA